MTKKYQKPGIKVFEIANDVQILAGTETKRISNNPTDITTNAPITGGNNDGTHEVGAKSNSIGVWDDEE